MTPESTEQQTKAEETETAEDAQKQHAEMQDLIKLFTAPVEDLTDEELDTTLERMFEMRKTRISTKKKQDYVVDILLPKLDTVTAEKVLKKFEADAMAAAEKKETKE